jgi:hypothetical protein
MSSLLSLPPEIVNTILEEVSGSDVMSIRRACRLTNALSSHQFGLKCLADLSFIWSSYSLQGLLDISRHPLGRYVKRLTFATHFIYAERLTEDPVEQREARLQNSFVQWDQRIELVVRALENLRELSVRPILGVYDLLVPWIALDASDSDSSDRRPRRGYGHEEFYGADKPEVSYPSFTHAVEYVLKAAQQANLPIRAFHIHWDAHTPHEHNELSVLVERHLFSEPGTLNPDFEFLTTLEHIQRFEVDIPNSTNRISIDTKRQKLELYTLKTKTVGVSHLPSILLEWESLDLTPLRLPMVMDHCFREIHLTFLHTSVGFLISFLKTQAETLRVLHLESIIMPLYDEALNPMDDIQDAALSFLSMLKDDLSLEYLRMTRLSAEEDRSRLVGGHDDTWVGKQEIQDGLQIYIQREEDGEHSVDEDMADDDDDGEWISVHHSEDEDGSEDQSEVWPGTLQNGTNGATTQQSGVRETEGSEA